MFSLWALTAIDRTATDRDVYAVVGVDGLFCRWIVLKQILDLALANMNLHLSTFFFFFHLLLGYCQSNYESLAISGACWNARGERTLWTKRCSGKNKITVVCLRHLLS